MDKTGKPTKHSNRDEEGGVVKGTRHCGEAVTLDKGSNVSLYVAVSTCNKVVQIQVSIKIDLGVSHGWKMKTTSTDNFRET